MPEGIGYGENIFQATTGVAGIQDRDIALASRMVEQSPGILEATGFMNYRGANTLIKGGRFDYLDPSVGGRAGRRAARLQSKYRVLDSSGSLVAPSAGQYMGGYRSNRGVLRRSRTNAPAMKRAQSKALKLSETLSKGGTVTGVGGLAGVSNFQARASRVNYLTGNPKAMGRYHSMSVFADAKYGAYSPFALGTIIGKAGPVKDYFTKRFGLTGVAEGESVFGPGLMSFISAGRKADRLEMRAAKGGRRGARATEKLARVDQNIKTLAGLNNPAMLGARPIYENRTRSLLLDDYKVTAKGAARAPKGGIFVDGKFYPGGQILPAGTVPYEQVRNKAGQVVTNKKGEILYRDAKTKKFVKADVATQKITERGIVTNALTGNIKTTMSAYDEALAMRGTVGVRGNMMASVMAGAGTRYMAGYFRGALGYGQLIRDGTNIVDQTMAKTLIKEGALVKGLYGEALSGSQAAIRTFGAGLEKAGLAGANLGAEAAERALAGGVFKTLGYKDVKKVLKTAEGAKVLAVRTIGMALPGVNALMMASLVYDLGAMAGEVVKSGINFARDANKSLQGSINKPMFGMGYKDTEAAATSRARGVMAIQNSRLNARSMLGSEAAMMAAHYG